MQNAGNLTISGIFVISKYVLKLRLRCTKINYPSNLKQSMYLSLKRFLSCR